MQQFINHDDYIDSQASEQMLRDYTAGTSSTLSLGPDPITDPHAAIDHAHNAGDIGALRILAVALADAMMGVRQ